MFYPQYCLKTQNVLHEMGLTKLQMRHCAERIPFQLLNNTEEPPLSKLCGRHKIRKGSDQLEYVCY